MLQTLVGKFSTLPLLARPRLTILNQTRTLATEFPRSRERSIGYPPELGSDRFIVLVRYKSDEKPEDRTAFYLNLLTSLLQSKEEALNSFMYTCSRKLIPGFAARLTECQAETLRKFPEVIIVDRFKLGTLPYCRKKCIPREAVPLGFCQESALPGPPEQTPAP